MEWFYTRGAERVGPVSGEQLDQLFQSGVIGPETLVQSSDMKTWVQYRTSRSPVASGSGICIECGNVFPTEDLVKIDNSSVCAGCKPVYLQRLKEGASGNPTVIWRSKRLLVLDRNGIFPDRCVKCNAPAEGYRLKRNLRWHSPILYILLISILLYAIVASIVSRRAVVEVGLCKFHQSKRKKDILIAWGVFLGSIICFILGAMVNAWIALVGVIAFLGALLYGSNTASIVTANRIDKNEIRLSGAGKAFLDSLPAK